MRHSGIVLFPALVAQVLLFCGLAAAANAQTPASAITAEEAVAEAIRANVALMAERANIPIAEARALTARLRPNPVFSIAGDHMDVLGTGFNDANAGGPTEIVVGAEFLVERGGKRQRRVDVTDKERAVTEMAFLDATRMLRLEVQTAFVNVLLARENLALAQQNLAAFNQIVEVNSARVKAGDLAEVELVRSRVAALQYANSVRRAELALRSAGTRLNALLGRKPGSPAAEPAGGLKKEAVVLSLKELQETALSARPDLRAGRLNIERAAAEVRLQLAQAKQDYTVGTEYRRQQVNARSNSLTVGVSMPLPFFNRNQGEIARSRQEQVQAELRVRALELEIAAEVETAANQVEISRRLLEAIEGKLLAEARDVREITDFAYRSGEASLLELLDAQRAFNETMQAFNDTRAEYAQSLYLLEAACGKEVTR
ncbi:MAG: TolC family protein [Bryobacterales bacterium]|nr:TolC family protein [Bryobacterales bacterium]